MSGLQEELERYLAIRRSLGYKLNTVERTLNRFIAFADAEGVDHLSTELFLRWQARSALQIGRPGRHASLR
jgi:hypothetical protein